MGGLLINTVRVKCSNSFWTSLLSSSRRTYILFVPTTFSRNTADHTYRGQSRHSSRVFQDPSMVTFSITGLNYLFLAISSIRNKRSNNNYTFQSVNHFPVLRSCFVDSKQHKT
jgi:hypothetical protein